MHKSHRALCNVFSNVFSTTHKTAVQRSNEKSVSALKMVVMTMLDSFSAVTHKQKVATQIIMTNLHTQTATPRCKGRPKLKQGSAKQHLQTPSYQSELCTELLVQDLQINKFKQSLKSRWDIFICLDAYFKTIYVGTTKVF